MLKRLINNILLCMKGNRGFTLLEIIVSLSILGFITSGLALTINTIYKDSNIAVRETVSLRQVQNAGFWITKDIQRAKWSTISTTVPGRFLDFDLFTGSSGSSTVHGYYIIANGFMTRYLADGSTLAVAQNVIGPGTLTTITSDNSTGTLEYVFNIAVSNGDDDSKTGTYRVQPRVQ